MRGNVVSLSAFRAERRHHDVAVDSHCAGQLAAAAYLAYQRAVAHGADPCELDRLLAELELHAEDYQLAVIKLGVKEGRRSPCYLY